MTCRDFYFSRLKKQTNFREKEKNIFFALKEASLEPQVFRKIKLEVLTLKIVEKNQKFKILTKDVNIKSNLKQEK